MTNDYNPRLDARGPATIAPNVRARDRLRCSRSSRVGSGSTSPACTAARARSWSPRPPALAAGSTRVLSTSAARAVRASARREAGARARGDFMGRLSAVDSELQMNAPFRVGSSTQPKNASIDR